MEAGIWSAPGTVLGRLASVRRTLAWAGLGREHLSQARYLGANCARLIDDVLRGEDLAPELRTALSSARAMLGEIDALPIEERLARLTDAGSALDRVLPLSQVDARPGPGELTPVGRLLIPPDEPVPRAPDDRPPRAADAPPPRAEAPARSPEPAREPRSAEPAEARQPPGHQDHWGEPLASLDLSPELLAALDAAGLSSIADLLLTPPVSHDRPPVLDLDAPEERSGMVRGKVRTVCLRFAPGSRRWEVSLAVGERVLTCRWAGEPPARAAKWRAGAEVAVVGTICEGDGRFTMDDPEPVGMDGRGSGWLPVYGVEGADDAALRDAVALALGRVMGGLRDPLSDDLLARHRLLPLDEALRDAHFPANPSARGRHRLAFEELLAVQIAISRRLGRGPGERGIAHKALHSGLGQLQVQFGLTLDDEQETAFAEIRRDLLRPVPMCRVLEGDVGTAKGVVALQTAVLVAENRSQVAYVTQDAAAAERHFLFAEPLLRAVGLKAIYVGDSVNHASADAIRRGEAHVVFGTPRVATGEVEWRRLGLVIVHEQAEFGSLLPHQLDGKGPRPDLLVVAAGPLPPLLLLAAYGPFDVSTIRRREPLRVSTRVFQSGERASAYDLVREQVQVGRQALVAFPVRDGRDVLSREDAFRVAEALRRDLLPEARVGVFSSEMSREERARVFDDFQHRRFDVLVTTTLIEDGPAVPNCTLVVLEHAEHFDLIRLHRLRGHVGHGPRQGHCLLVLSDAPSPDGLQRLARVSGDSIRLELTDEDLGVPGGPKVSAAAAAMEPPVLAWAELPRDRDLLLEARTEALGLLREDSGLRAHPALRKLIQERWPELVGEPERPVSQESARGKRRKRRKRRR